MPNSTSRSRSQLMADRAKVASLYLRGESLHSIAMTMGVQTHIVTADLKAIREDWRSQANYDFGLARQQELARIDMIEAEAWRAWETSKAPLEVTNTRQRRRNLGIAGQDIPTDSISEANKRSTQRDPNPAFLERVAWCVEMRCKILSLVAPQEMKHTGTVTHIKEIHYQPSPVQSSAGGRLVIIGGPSAALPGATPADLAESYPDAAYGAPDLAGDPESADVS